MKWPEKKGLYVCEHDGKRKILHHHHCCNNGRHWWTDTAGYDVIGSVKVISPYAVQRDK